MSTVGTVCDDDGWCDFNFERLYVVSSTDVTFMISRPSVGDHDRAASFLTHDVY